MAEINWPKDGKHVFVGGEWIELKGVDQIPSISPATEENVGQIAAARAHDIDQAVEAIQPALRPWGAMSAMERTSYMRKFAQQLTQHADELVEIEIEDSGLTRRKAIQDIQDGINKLSSYAAYATEIKGNTFASSSQTLAYTERVPYGIVARIVPFNHPFKFAVEAIAATVLAGNAVIVKPPEQCSLSTLALAELARGVFPPGIVNVVTGYGHEAGAALVAHPNIPRIGFTGSVPTGRRILEGAASHIKRVSLELGGKNPLVITANADTEFAAKAALSGMNFTHAGQSCQSTSRVLIHADCYEEVLGKLEDRICRLVVGDPKDEKTDTGPLAFKSHYERVMNYIGIGIKEGAVLRTGGKRPAGLDRGYYVEPTLFADVTEDMQIANEEIFGPVVCVMRWERQEEAIRLANATEYGLNSRVIAGTVDEGLAIAREIEAGTSIVNYLGGRAPGMPFGGFKQSGMGVLACLEEVLSYTQEKCYTVAL